MPPLSHLTSSTPTKSNLYFANSLAAAVSEPALYRLQTFQVPILIFHCLGCTKLSVQVWGCLWIFHKKICFYGEESLASPPTARLEDHSVSAVRSCLFNIFAATSILEDVPPSTAWRSAMPWWQGPTYHGYICPYSIKYHQHIHAFIV